MRLLDLLFVLVTVRTRNAPGPEHCEYCADIGWVVFDTGVPEELWPVYRAAAKVIYGESYGPCPMCERGGLVEFPVADKHGVARRPPWGADGFWRGRMPQLVPLPSRDKPLPQAENARRMRELAGRAGVRSLTEEPVPRGKRSAPLPGTEPSA